MADDPDGLPAPTHPPALFGGHLIGHVGKGDGYREGRPRPRPGEGLCADLGATPLAGPVTRMSARRPGVPVRRVVADGRSSPGQARPSSRKPCQPGNGMRMPTSSRVVVPSMRAATALARVMRPWDP